MKIQLRKRRSEEVILFTSRRRFSACSVSKPGYRRWEKTALHWLQVHIMIFFLFSLLSRTTEAKSNTQQRWIYFFSSIIFFIEQTFLFSLFKRKYKISLSLRYNKIQKLEINFKVYYYPDTVFFSSVFCFLPLMHLRRNFTVLENHQISLTKDNQHAKKNQRRFAWSAFGLPRSA